MLMRHEFRFHPPHPRIVETMEPVGVMDKKLAPLLAAPVAVQRARNASAPPMTVDKVNGEFDHLRVFVRCVHYAPCNLRCSNAWRIPSFAPWRAPPKSPFVLMFCSI